MKKTLTYKLSACGISSALEKIQSVLRKKKYNNKQIIHTSFIMEECLLYYQKIFGPNKTFNIIIKNKLFFDLVISVEGEEHKLQLNKDDDYLNHVWNYIQQAPTWKYKVNTNFITIPIIRTRPSQIFSLLAVILFVVIFCAICQFLPHDITSNIHDGFITPTKNFFLAALIGFACPVIFFSIFFGIINISDIKTFKKSGQKLTKSLFTLSVISFLIVSSIGLLFLNFETDVQSNMNISITELYSLLIKLIPTNPITSFVEKNTVQIVILAILLGIVCIYLEERIKHIKKVLYQAFLIFEKLFDIIIAILPVIIFFILADAFMMPDLSLVLHALELFLFCIFACALVLIIQLIVMKMFKKISITEYLKNAKECLLISLATASSLASYKTSIKLCIDYLKIDKNTTIFGIPICQVFYCPTLAIFFAATCFFGSMQAGTSVNAVWIIAVLIISFILSISIPPVPGGSVAVLTILIGCFGLPAEFVTIASSMILFLDFPSTAVCVQGFHTVLSIADSSKAVDK